ncbi:class A sortase [Leuconostoc miyukkimchii]|uniref:class A sortase n=1 Tax=Leuconostoc miyukkimchii TaxID=910540 RepID=UPI001C7CA28F|nr:class A sortase [Leuconostoc miyukkimchii]
MFPFIYSITLVNETSQNSRQLILVGIIFLSTIILFTIGQLIIKYKRKKYHISILNSIISACIITFFSIAGLYAYQINIFGVKDISRKYLQKYERQKIDKQSTNDKTTYDAIQKMVMRDASKGLEKQGFVAIPSQNILLPIYNDAYSEKGLNAGANYANRSAVDPEGSKVPIMGQGNYGLAAHNFNDGHTGFSALQQSTNHDSPYLVNGQLKGSSWLNGKTILMANNKGIYRYVITGQTAVSSSQVSVLNPTRQPELTIISCLFPSTDFRIITRAKLRTTYTWRQAPSKYVSEFNLKVRNTNAHVDWWNPGVEEGANGDQGGLKK